MDKQELNKIMNINVNNVAKVQHDSLKQFVLDKIDEVRKLVETEKYEEIEDLAFTSLSGDYGDYNRCVNFAYQDNNDEDLLDTIDMLQYLKDKINK